MAEKLNWRTKLHPVFFELAELNREFEITFARMQLKCLKKLIALGRTASPAQREKVVACFKEDAAKLMTKLDTKLVEINRRYPQLSYNPLAYSYFDLASGQSDQSDSLFAYLHWMRHRESLPATVSGDAKGDIKAYRKLVRTGEDYRRIAHEKGPLKPFQGDTLHRQFLELMLCYETEPLTAEERADCADAHCACGGIHDPDALKKQLARLTLDLTASHQHSAKPKRRK